MNPSADQYDSTVDKINTAETLADTGLDILPLFLVGVGILLVALVLWFAMRSLAD